MVSFKHGSSSSDRRTSQSVNSFSHILSNVVLTPFPSPDLELLQHFKAEQLAPLSAGPPVLQTPSPEHARISRPAGKSIDILRTPVMATKRSVKIVERIVIDMVLL